VPPVSVEEVVAFFSENNERLRELLLAVAPAIPTERGCACGTALSGARIGH
jgi:5'-methylthioadenosine phosphorylase